MSYAYGWEYIHNYLSWAIHKALQMGHEDVFWKVVICVALSIGRQSLVGFVGSNGPRAEFICFLKEHTENDPVCESGIYSFY